MSQLVEVKKYAYIDALRGIAVLGTLMVHCSIYEKGINNFGDFFKDFASFGAFGVQLFFLLSGLTLFLSSKDNRQNEKHQTLNFYVRRFFRIAPLFYFAILIYIITYFYGAPNWWLDKSGLSIKDLLFPTLFFINSFHPNYINSLMPGGWSIAVEMIFYLILPLLFKFINSISRAHWLFFISLIIYIVTNYFLINHQLVKDKDLWNSFCYFSFFSQLPIFCLGILLYFYIKEENMSNVFSAKSQLPLFFIIILLIFNVILNFIPIHVLISSYFFALVFIISSKKNIIFENKILIFIGKISYSMYLFHYVMLFVMWKLNLLDLIDSQLLNFVFRFFILLLFTIILSYFTYKYIELPFIKLGKKVIIRYNKI
jgi:peptidoglycan/LPS O-acetylase OafA/YrhL